MARKCIFAQIVRWPDDINDVGKVPGSSADGSFISMAAEEVITSRYLSIRNGNNPELMAAYCIVVGLICVAIGAFCTAGVCSCVAMLLFILRGAKCGAEALICVSFKCWRVWRWLWYFRRKIWRIHRVRLLALVIICAFSNPGWSKGGDTSLPDGANFLKAPPRVHDVYGHVMEMPMECFRRKTVRHDPFVGVCVGEALRPWPLARSGDARALKFVESARRDPSCGFGLAEPPPGAIKPMKVVTANCTCWKSIRGFLGKPIPGVQAADRAVAGGADAVLVQEHHLLDHELAAVSVWCLANGWKSMWSPACSTEDGGTTSGVAILVKAEFGLIDRHVFEAAAHRGLAATFQYPGTPDVKLVCLYLESGSPLQGPSALLCGQVCSFLKAWDSLFVIGGDFNCLPATFLRSKLMESINTQLFAPGGTVGTCKGKKGRTRTIDYFLVDPALSCAVKSVAIVSKGGMSPHSPVCLEFIPRVGSTQVRKLMKAPRLPTKRIIGPIAKAKSWGGVRRIAQWALWLTFQSSSVHVAEYLDFSFAQFFSQAAEEIHAATDTPLPAENLRGSKINCSWKPLNEPPPRNSVCVPSDAQVAQSDALKACDTARATLDFCTALSRVTCSTGGP